MDDGQSDNRVPCVARRQDFHISNPRNVSDRVNTTSVADCGFLLRIPNEMFSTKETDGEQDGSFSHEFKSSGVSFANHAASTRITA